MAHSKDDNPTANRPWFGPIPTGGDWNPAHGADPDVIDFHRYAAGEPEHLVSLIGRHSHAPESHPLATNLAVANGSTPAPRCRSLTSTSATPIRTFRFPPLRGRTRERDPNAPDYAPHPHGLHPQPPP